MVRNYRHVGWGAAAAAAFVLTLGAAMTARGEEAARPASGSQCSMSALWTVAAEPSRGEKVAGVRNFGKLNDHVWRSGQPSEEGYKNLVSMGLKTVVNLRRETGPDGDPVPAGVKKVYIPIADEHAPTPEQAEQFLAVVSDPANWPVLVHCQGGEGRAGVMSAIVRYSFDGWDDERIQKETTSFRHAHFIVKLPMAAPQRAFIHDWAAKHQRGEYLQRVVMAP